MFIYCICTQYLVGAPFALITASIQRGMEVISLWHCWCGMEAQVSLIAAFRSSALLGLVSLIFLLTLPHRFSMGFRSGEFAGQSSTPTPWSLNQLLVPLAVWAGAKSCWKMKSASPWSLSAEGSMKCSKNFLVDGCVDCGLQKTQWTNTSRWHGSPNHHWLWKLHTGLQATWILCLSTLPPDSVPLHSSSRFWDLEMKNLLSSEKRTLDHWATVQFFFSTAQVRCFWCRLWFSGLVALFLKTSERGDSWCTDYSFSPLLVKLSQVFESTLLNCILKLAVIPVACAPFPTQILPSSQLCI